MERSAEPLPSLNRDRLLDVVEEFWDFQLVEEIYSRHPLDTVERFRDAFHRLFGHAGRLHFAGSARQALSLVLKALGTRSVRRRVLISKFNCGVVGSAVTNAGLDVETFDFSTPSGSFDWDAIARRLESDHLAIIVPHFFGIPTDFTPLLSEARRKNVMVLEDCAHSLGATINGVTAGTIGDAAVFSFNYDKPISLAGGGALLVNNPEISLRQGAHEMSPSAVRELGQFRRTASVLRHVRSLHPRRSMLQRVANRLHMGPLSLPKLPSGIGPLRAAVGLWQLERYDSIRGIRNRNAEALIARLGGRAWFVGQNVGPAHLKLRLVVEPANVESAIRRCRQSGIIAANANWPTLVRSGSQSVDFPNALKAARFGVDVPVHQNLRAEDLDRIEWAFADCPAIDR